MKKKKLVAGILAFSMLTLAAFPSFASTWAQENGKWKCYSDNGNLVIGWEEYNGNWYFMDASGTMKTGWVKDNNSWYFMHDDGTMAHDVWIDNYYVNASGKWTQSR